MPKAIDRERMPYRFCVGICLINDAGQVFAGRRKPKAGVPQAFEWQFPQGGIDKGEDALAAAKRELFEETNISSIDLIYEVPKWLSYDLPEELLGKALKGKYRGQQQRWYVFKFTGDESEINVTQPANGEHPAEFSEWAWRDIEDMPDLIVPFKKALYEELVALVQPQIEAEQQK
ncbi:putative (di)nucleoside polyphosphate hydrolase [Maritalea mobilis]|uniref:RNA pyrophosphohydrolase n=1 Tax=Maritalea mobilis TaxID=483324 RepID=A0A4R6VPP0_9HYPH|nr:RNA pyrophosphohydrolase [Maritalea mobilis]TDQ64242.1 putative (di)nucleoside polyphosphate hydrolase [Maritalea mobilis]